MQFRHQPSPINTFPLPVHEQLCHLTNHLISIISLQVVNYKIVFINEIPTFLPIVADRQKIAVVLQGLLLLAASNAGESCMHLSAKVYGNVVLVHIKKPGNFYRVEFESELSKLHTIAEEILGSVTVNGERKDLTTLTFGFPNVPPVN